MSLNTLTLEEMLFDFDKIINPADIADTALAQGIISLEERVHLYCMDNEEKLNWLKEKWKSIEKSQTKKNIIL